MIHDEYTCIYPYILLHGKEITEMLYSFDFVLEM